MQESNDSATSRRVSLKAALRQAPPESTWTSRCTRLARPLHRCWQHINSNISQLRVKTLHIRSLATRSASLAGLRSNSSPPASPRSHGYCGKMMTRHAARAGTTMAS